MTCNASTTVYQGGLEPLHRISERVTLCKKCRVMQKTRRHNRCTPILKKTSHKQLNNKQAQGAD